MRRRLEEELEPLELELEPELDLETLLPELLLPEEFELLTRELLLELGWFEREDGATEGEFLREERLVLLETLEDFFELLLGLLTELLLRLVRRLETLLLEPDLLVVAMLTELEPESRRIRREDVPEVALLPFRTEEVVIPDPPVLDEPVPVKFVTRRSYVRRRSKSRFLIGMVVEGM